jgi:hypothetical protein
MSLFLFIYCIKHTELDSFIHTFITFAETCSRFPHRLSLSRGISIGLPSRDLNPWGLPYSRSTQSKLCRTLSDLRRTQVWATPHPIWATPHTIWATPHPNLCYTAPNLIYVAPKSELRRTQIWAMSHSVWATLHPIWATHTQVRATPHPVWATQQPNRNKHLYCPPSANVYCVNNWSGRQQSALQLK